jgi:IclR family pca regulon transcriptional regulator
VLGIADLAAELGLTRSTTHRYAITLVALGYLEQGASRKYQLGLRVADLGMSALNSMGLRDHARPYLEELRLRTSYTVSMSVIDGPEVLYVDRLRGYDRGARQVTAAVAVGSRLPAHLTAMGKLLLAHLPAPEQAEALQSLKLGRYGPNTLRSTRQLREELAVVREEPITTSNEELAAGLVAIAAPVHNEARDVVAAISLSTHITTATIADLVVLAPHLIATADRVSAGLERLNDTATAA